jgi:hypothetical protein
MIQSALLNFIYLDVMMTDKWLVKLIYGSDYKTEDYDPKREEKED